METMTDTEVEASDVTEVDTDAGPETDSRRWVGARRAGVLVVLVAVIVAGGWGGWQYRLARSVDQMRGQAVTLVHEYLVAMSAFDYQHLDANHGTIVADSTPEFSRKYDDMIKALRDIVISSKGVATATADHVAVERIDARSATVLGFVDQHVVNVTAPQGSDQKYRMLVSLTRNGDRWIVSDVQTV